MLAGSCLSKPRAATPRAMVLQPSWAMAEQYTRERHHGSASSRNRTADAWLWRTGRLSERTDTRHLNSRDVGRAAAQGKRLAGTQAGHSKCFSPERARHSTLEQDDQLSQPGRQPLEVLDAPLEAIVSSTFNKVIDDRAQRLSAVAQVADGAVVKAAGVEGGDAQDIGRVRLGFAKKACGWAAAALRRNLCERNFPGTVLTPPPQPVGRVGQCTHEEISHRRF